MVEIVENWSRISGRVEIWEPPAASDAAGTLAVSVERVETVARDSGATYANLLADTKGRTLRIHVPSTAAESIHLSAGSRIVLDVRRGRTPDQLFARPGSVISK
jgi:hypothetical protein